MHASPVTGMGTKISEISRIVHKAPSTFIIVDGIQHAAHGGLILKVMTSMAMLSHPIKCFHDMVLVSRGYQTDKRIHLTKS